jgi:hypothetical protein
MAVLARGVVRPFDRSKVTNSSQLPTGGDTGLASVIDQQVPAKGRQAARYLDPACWSELRGRDTIPGSPPT